MKTIISLLTLVCLAATLTVTRAQLVADGFTTTINGISTNIVGDLTIGTNASIFTNGLFTTLIVTNAGTVSNSGLSHVGLNSGADYGLVLLTGTNSVWSSGDNFELGRFGAFNRLVVTNGARMQNPDATVGFGSIADGNFALVAGAGSSWSNSQTLTVGLNGSANSLSVSNGGYVVSSGGYIGANAINNASGDDNQILITGAGSRWTNKADLFVGNAGSQNRLVVNNGGTLGNSANLNIGYGNNSDSNLVAVGGGGLISANTSSGVLRLGNSGSLNQLLVTNGGTLFSRSATLGANAASHGNVVTVTGVGSLWTNSGNVNVGSSGWGNELKVGLYASAFAPGLYLGLASPSSNNLVSVGYTCCNITGPNPDPDIDYGQQGILIVTNSTRTGITDVRRGVLRLESGEIQMDFLSLTNGDSGNIEFYGGKLTVWGGLLDGYSHLSVGIAGGVATAPAVLDVRSNKPFVLQAALILGEDKSYSRLFITNGGALHAAFTDTWVGHATNSRGNVAVVANANSAWTNYGELWFGYAGASNRLAVTNGGRLQANSSVMGWFSSSSNNSAVVSGAGSLWTNVSDLAVGVDGAGNSLTVSDGGVVAGRYGYIGDNPGSKSNSVAVSGVNSMWTNSSGLFVGFFGGSNRLTVTEGGKVHSASGAVGWLGGADGNLAQVSGQNSRWVSGDSLYIGSNAMLNQLIVSDGGVVSSGFGSVGDNGVAGRNEVRVTGAGSAWTNQAALYIGNAGSINRLTITNGGTVADGIGYVGFAVTGRSNQVYVTGTNSLWANGQGLHVGYAGYYNLVEVSNGGQLSSATDGVIGNQYFPAIGPPALGSYNLVRVTGEGSRWSNGADLHVGRGGVFNRLVVNNGGTVLSSNVWFGYSSTSDGNTAIVTDPGSVWTNHGDLNIGRLGTGNYLIVTNGGAVHDSSATVGYSAPTNFAIVTDAGSVWSNRSTLSVGSAGGHNRLTVTNGGTVFSQDGEIGSTPGIANNSALVTGAGSKWLTASSLYVGKAGVNNQLTAASTGQVLANNCYVGFDPASGNNIVNLTGGGSLIATNLAGTSVTDVRRGVLQLQSGGLLRTDNLLLTNGAQSGFYLLEGTVQTGNTTCNNGSPFGIPDANSPFPGTLELLGNGTHTFANGLEINNHGLLTGNGTIVGNVTMDRAILSPGASIGRIAIFGNVNFGGGTKSTTYLEINKTLVTNDNITVSTTLNYGGKLVVTNVSGALAAGDSFRLFTSTNYSGSFNSISLPPLGAGLTWTNKLLVDGSIEVLGLPPGDRYWTNVLGGNYDAGGNWFAGVVPSAIDNAYFTSNASYQVTWPASAFASNAYFNASLGTVTQAIGSAAWTLTSSYIVGRDAGATATVAHVSGTLNVTNAAGNALLESRRGALSFDGGTINVDRLIATNPVGQITFNGGALVVRGGTISNTVTFRVGVGGTVPAVLDVQAGQPFAVESLSFGNQTPNNLMLVTNGGLLSAGASVVGSAASSSNNVAVLSGAGSLWTIVGTTQTLDVGSAGSFNQLMITNGSIVSVAASASAVRIGQAAASSNNVLTVADANSSLLVGDGGLFVGDGGSFNQLVTRNMGTVATPVLYLGFATTSSNNLLNVAGGNLIVTNASNTGLIDVRRGTLGIGAGLLRTDSLSLTNGSASGFNFPGGTLQTRNTTCNNGALFRVGFGFVSPVALFELLGSGTHSFANGLQINRSGTLKGNGTVIGDVTVFRGVLSPGASVGRLTINGNLTLTDVLTTNLIDLDKGAGTNDSIVGLTNVTYAGWLVVTNLSGTLADGDSFKLFSAGAYSGAFAGIAPATPGPGLQWNTNGLTIDGTLRVVAITSAPPVISSATVSSGTNLALTASGGVPNDPVYLLASTNVNLPATNWSRMATNYFDAAGNASFTQVISSAEPGRYFRLQVQ